MNVTHAAVSQQVRGLESELGAELVQRQGRGVALTAEGELLAQSLAKGFSEIQDGVERLASSGAMRALNISPTPTFAAHWLMARIPDFKREYPETELILNPTGQVVDLQPGGVDMSIRFGEGDWPGVEVELLMPTDYVVVGATSLVGEDKIYEPSELQDFPWLIELGTNELATWLEKQGVVPRTNLNLTQMPGYMVSDSLRRGMGITVTGRMFVEAEIQAGSLRVLFEEVRSGRSGYYLVRRPGVMRPPLKNFCTWIKRMARESLSAPA